MIKKILVPTDGSENALVGARYAVALAERYGAQLHGLHVVDVKLLEGPFLRDISASLGTAPFVNYQNVIASLLEERGEAALSVLSGVCERAHVAITTGIETGRVVSCIAEKSALMDLIVMGQRGEHGEWLEGLIGSTTQAVIRRAQCPVLVTERETAKITRFFVPYDGSVHAKKALQIGADIGNTWEVPFDVVVVGGRRVDLLIDEARSYLQAHEVEVDYVTRGGDPSEEIVEYARGRSVDLIVMGAYGHTKVRELVVGSTTAYTVNHAPCPVLLTR